MNGSRACNVQQLFYYLTETLPKYYSQRNLDIISGRTQNITKYFPSKTKLENLEIIQESGEFFIVKNSNSNFEYQVNVTLGFCSCPVGNNGGPCKHQHFVCIEKEQFCPNIIPIDETEKMKYHYIAVENMNVDKNWYSPLLTKKDFSGRAIDTNSEDVNYDSNIAVDENFEFQQKVDDDKISCEVYEKKWEKVTSVLKEKFLKNPSETAHAMDSMITKFSSIKTDSFLFSAMYNFGKIQYKAVKAGRRATSKPVQPIAISRKKNTVGARKCQQSGRPSKFSYAPEHNYGKRKRRLCQSFSTKTQRAPHSLQECIHRNCSPGK